MEIVFCVLEENKGEKSHMNFESFYLKESTWGKQVLKKKNYKDRAKMRQRMSIAAFTLTLVFAILILRLSYIMIVKRAAMDK
jgi:hypothetical protein